MTHLSMETLLSLREAGRRAGRRRGPGAPGRPAPRAGPSWSGSHQRVARLKALPALRPARDRWPAVRGPGPGRAAGAAAQPVPRA